MQSHTPEVIWFRLAVRGIGVLVLAFGLPQLGQQLIQAGTVFFDSTRGSMFPAGYEWWPFIQIVGPVMECGVGLYLLFGARGLIAYCCRGALGVCPACNYDVRNVTAAICPECGSPLPGRVAGPPPPVSG